MAARYRFILRPGPAPALVLALALPLSGRCLGEDGPAGTSLLEEAVLIGSDAGEWELPASGVYLGSGELEGAGSLDINRVLRNVPGVSLREEDGWGLFPNLSVRGVSTERSKSVLLMEDGIPSSPAPYSAPSAYYSPNVGRMSGLEVLKGSSQIRYGPSTTGGVINYLSTPIPSQSLFRSKLSYGSNQELVGHFQYGDRREAESGLRYGYLVEGFHHRTDGFKKVEGTQAFGGDGDTGFQRTEPMVKAFLELPGEWEHALELKYGYTDLDADETYLGLSPEDFEASPFRRYAASRLDSIQTENHRASVRHTMSPSDSLRISATGYLQHFSRNWAKLHQLRDPGLSLSEALLDIVPGGGLDVLRGSAPGVLRVRNNNRDYRIYGVQTVASLELETGGVAHRLDTGLRYHFDEVDRFQWNEDYEQDAGGALAGKTVGAMGAAGDRVQQSRALALFTQNEMQYRRWTLMPGIRMEWIGQEYEQDMRRSDGGGSPDTGEGDLQVWGGGVTLAYQIQPQWKAFAGVHRGFSLPGPRSAIRSGLEEETSLGLELGTRFYRHEQGIEAVATLFHTRFRDLIVGGNLGGGGTAITENVGKVHASGLELSLGYDPGLAGDWSVRTPLQMALTLHRAVLASDATNTDPDSIFEGGEDGSRVPYIPRYTLGFQAGIEAGRFDGGLAWSFVSSTFTSASNSTEPLRSDGAADVRIGEIGSYWVADLFLQYQLKPQVSLFGGIRNLWDQRYVASLHPYGPRPGAPRLFHAGVDVAF